MYQKTKYYDVKCRLKKVITAYISGKKYVLKKDLTAYLFKLNYEYDQCLTNICIVEMLNMRQLTIDSDGYLSLL